MTSEEWKKLCEGCRYYRATCSRTAPYFCHYCVDTGKLRGPQEPGKCDKKDTAKKRKIVGPRVGRRKSRVVYKDI